MKYLLPCECGQSVPVEISQAGDQVACVCGRTLSVPSLRAIRQLQPAGAVEPAQERRAAGGGWNATKGAVFAIGALLCVGGLITAWHNYQVYSQVSLIKPSEEQFDEHLAQIENMTAEEMWGAWEGIKAHPLEPAGSSPFAVYKGVASESEFQIKAGIAVAVVGLVFAIGSIFIPTRP